METKIGLHKSQIFLYLLLAFLFGSFLGQFFHPLPARILFYSAAIVSIATVTAFWGNWKILLSASLLLAAALGIWRFGSALPAIDERHLAFYNGSGQMEWEGIIAEEPDVRADKVNLAIKAVGINQVTSKQDPKISLAEGKVLVTVGRYPEYRYGDRLKITGKLEQPFESADFSYKNYLAKGGIYSVSYFPKISLVASGQGNLIKAQLLNFKQRFIDGLSRILPEPQNAFLAGLLVGARRAIPEGLLAMFKITGVTHIIAISGFNISIITRILGRFIQTHFGRRAALLITVLVVCGFVVITGAQASVVRAAIMGVVLVVGLNLGRMSRAFNILVLAGAGMVALNPQVLIFDVGFQLSFLATAGLIFFAETLERAFRKIPEIFELRSILAATLSAQIFVWPLLIYNFDQLSLISPLVNILILTIIPITIIFGFI
ncbi:MAG: ComEC/Rec2 family competence protein, partial [Patescibacteria group bacterium]